MTTSTLTLISHPLCPFVQRAAIVLLEKNVAFERINVDLADKPDWFLALSPTGKVPLLKVERAGEEDAVLFESMVICEYLEETQDGGKLYSENALSRAHQRAWIEYGTATLADAWQFLNAKDRATADARRAALRGRLEKLEGTMEQGPYFSGSGFSMVDAVFAPVFRYFGLIDPTVTQPIFHGLPRVSQWRESLASRDSVAAAVGQDYADRFRQHLTEHQALLAD
ncbi:glutathione S-transferase family protein [Xanthomonas bundabergensis]|uniref:glutathione S-transferase family protein n=1 Tax=Xanthomonas bundabergensis TaxID=3160842 RepID=UPI0035177CF0